MIINIKIVIRLNLNDGTKTAVTLNNASDYISD